MNILDLLNAPISLIEMARIARSAEAEAEKYRREAQEAGVS